MEELLIIQAALKLGLGGCILGLILKITQARIKLATGELGSTLKDKRKPVAGNNGIQVSKKHQLSKEASQRNVLLFGPNGSGKSTTEHIPNLLQNDIRGSIIVYDPAGEIYNLTSKYQKSIGRKVLIYNPLIPGKIEYNILRQCRNDREVVQLAQALLINGALSIELATGKKAGGAEWLQLSQNLLTACMLHSKSLNQDIKYALSLISENEIEELENVFKNKALDYLKAFLSGADAIGLQASIKGTLTSNLGLFYDDLAISKTAFTAEMLRKEEIIIYVQYPEHMAYYLAPLMAPLYSQLINQLIDIKGNDIWFFLDEFANIGQFTGFNITISTARKRGISFFLCVQDFNQIKQVYGPDIAETIWSNCCTKVTFPGLSSIDTIKKLSELCDEEEIEIQQENKKVKTKKRLFTPGEIRRIETNHCLIITDNLQPVLDETNYYKNSKQYLERCNL